MRIIKVFIIIFLIFFTFYTTHKVKKEILSEKEMVEEYGKKAPEFILKNMDGKEISTNDLKKSGVILIFFATWCGPCKMELEIISEEEKAIYNYNAKLFLISNEEKEKVKKFMEVNEFNFEVLFDEKGDVFKNYNVNSIPKTVIIDEKGTIIFSKVGKIDSFYGLLQKLPYRLAVVNRGRKLYETVDRILSSIPCPCNCGEPISKCSCKDCKIKSQRESIRFYCARLIDKEKFKEEQVAQIIKWKYIENEEKK